MVLQLTDVLGDPGVASTVFDCLLLADGAQVRLASKACAAAVAAHPWGVEATVCSAEGASRLAKCFPALRALSVSDQHYYFGTTAAAPPPVTDAQLRAFTNLRRLALHNTATVTGGCFAAMPALEELAIESSMAHAPPGVTDAALATAARLRRLRLDGRLLLTGAALKALTRLEDVEVRYNDYMDPALVFYNAREWPRLRHVHVDGCRLMPPARLDALLPSAPGDGEADDDNEAAPRFHRPGFTWKRPSGGGGGDGGSSSAQAAVTTAV